MKTLKCARNLLILVLLFISMLFLCSLPAREDAFAGESDAHVHTDHDGWTEVTPLVGGLVGGEDGQPARYYLDGDVVLEDTLSVSGNVVLCLGGHKLSVLQGTDTGIICVKEGAALTLCDCNGETEHTYYIDNSGLPVFFEGEIPDDAPAEAMVESVSGGIIAGGYGSAGGGIVIEGATVCMYGGTIVGNFSEQYGGGIYMNGANSRLEMFGGSICRNSAKSRGGGVYVCENGQFVMNGGTLSSNVAETEGGGVFIDIGGDFTLSGGLITGNSAVDGGGIYSYGRQYFGGGEVFIDGGGHLTVFLKIIIPIMMPTLCALYILAFIGSWNDYSASLIYLPSVPTLAYGLYLFQYDSAKYGASLPEVLAGFAICSIPSVVLFCSFQKVITKSLTVGGLKE